MSDPERGPLSVLVIEDDEDDIEALEECFEAVGELETRTLLTDGEQAVDYLVQLARGEAPRPDLMLLDLGLPKLDGFAVLDELKKHEDLRRLPVVVFTSSEREEDVVRSYDLGACTFVQKPLTVERFQEVIRGLSLYWSLITRVPERGEDASST